MRGYLVQTLVCLLELLEEADWESVTVEPSGDAEKVDILWKSSMKVRVVQVKSSQDGFSPGEVRKWAEGLESSYAADEYELQPVGSCSPTIIGMKRHERVRIAPPKNLDIGALLAQAMWLLDRHIANNFGDRVRPEGSELIIGALSTRLSGLAASGTPLTKAALSQSIYKWAKEVAPQFVRRGNAINCGAGTIRLRNSTITVTNGGGIHNWGGTVVVLGGSMNITGGAVVTSLGGHTDIQNADVSCTEPSAESETGKSLLRSRRQN
jgi:hypothetical protein